MSEFSSQNSSITNPETLPALDQGFGSIPEPPEWGLQWKEDTFSNNLQQSAECNSILQNSGILPAMDLEADNDTSCESIQSPEQIFSPGDESMEADINGSGKRPIPEDTASGFDNMNRVELESINGSTIKSAILSASNEIDSSGTGGDQSIDSILNRDPAKTLPDISDRDTSASDHNNPDSFIDLLSRDPIYPRSLENPTRPIEIDFPGMLENPGSPLDRPDEVEKPKVSELRAILDSMEARESDTGKLALKLASLTGEPESIKLSNGSTFVAMPNGDSILTNPKTGMMTIEDSKTGKVTTIPIHKEQDRDNKARSGRKR